MLCNVGTIPIIWFYTNISWYLVYKLKLFNHQQPKLVVYKQVQFTNTKKSTTPKQLLF